jgi:hypothetical protein
MRSSILRVYCEHGAFTTELRKLKIQERVEVVLFPYEERARRVHWAVPSLAQVRDVERLTVDELSRWPINEFRGSSHLDAISRVIGNDNRIDALHVDSALKSGCACMFTKDSDIFSKRVELERLTGMRFLHPQNDWQEFLGLLDIDEEKATDE